METTLDKFGRVVIPKEIRDDLGLRPGEVIQIEESGDEVVLKPLREKSPLNIKDGVLVFTGSSTGDITGAVSSHRGERLKKMTSLRRK